jgi:hypothetical protein
MEGTEVTKQEKPGPIDIQFKDGILPGGYKETMQLAALLHKSGLAPKSLDTLEKTAVAAMMCLELGRPIMTGIQDMAVINGKCSIYGDAALALVRASGLLEEFEEWNDGIPYTPEWTFYCKMKRKGFPANTGEWSWADADKAGCANPKTRDGKQDIYSPWSRYPHRMMQFKARNFIMRDLFGDVLKGVKTQEEAYEAMDLEPDGNGAWSVEPPAKPAPKEKASIEKPAPSAPSFDDIIMKPSGLQPDVVNEFLSLTADGNSMPVETVKAEAVKDPSGFMEALNRWVEKQKADPEKVEDPPPKTKIDNVDTVRAEFVNLKSSGFSTWFHKNKTRILEFDKEIQDEIKAKWGRVYPDVDYPLSENKPESTVSDAASKVFTCNLKHDGHPFKTTVTLCAEGCSKAKNCQLYQEKVFENAESAN